MEGSALFDGIQDVTERICRIGDIPEVGPDQMMYEAGFSSIDALDLLVDLETAYSVSISDEDFMLAQTPRALYTLITRLRKEQRRS
jgi:acyl carrier protein